MSALLALLLAAAPVPSRLPIEVTIESKPFDVRGALVYADENPDHVEIELPDRAASCQGGDINVRSFGLVLEPGPGGEIPRERWLKAHVDLQRLAGGGYGALRPQHMRVRLTDVPGGRLRVEFKFEDDYRNKGFRGETVYLSKGAGVIDATWCGKLRARIPKERDASVAGPLRATAMGKTLKVGKAIARVSRFSNDVALNYLVFFSSDSASCDNPPVELFALHEPAYACEHGIEPGAQHAQFTAGREFPARTKDPGELPSSSWRDVPLRSWVSLSEAKLEAGGTVKGTLSVVDAKGDLTVQGEFEAVVCRSDRE